MTTVSRRGWWLLALLVPICYWVGTASTHAHMLAHATVYEPLLYLFVPGAIAGLLLGLLARILGLDALRTLLSPAQAALFGTLASALVAITLTGAAWASYNEDEVGQVLWTVLSGAATLTFFGVWGLLAMRAAAATKALTAGATLVLGAFASFAIGLWALAILSQWFERHQPEPSVPIFLIVYLLFTVAIYLPIGLIACGTAGLVGGLGRNTPAAPSPPATFPADPAPPFVPPTPAPAQPHTQLQPGQTYHGEEPSPPLPNPAPAPGGPATHPAAGDAKQEVPAPSEIDRG